MLIGLRELQHDPPAGDRKQARKKARLPWERLAYWMWKELLRRPWMYRLGLRLAKLFLRFRSRDEWIARLPGPGAGWTAARDFPAPAKESFRQRWKALSREEPPR
jgi:L-lactate dehydrogenase complex protein LldF